MASIRVFMTRRVPTTSMPEYLRPVEPLNHATALPQRLPANDSSLPLSPANTSLSSNDTAKIRIRKFSNTQHSAKPFVFETTPPPRTVREQIPLFAGFKSGSESSDIHFKRLGVTAMATEFAHLKFRFNVSDSLHQLQQLLKASQVQQLRCFREHGNNFSHREYEALNKVLQGQLARAQAIQRYAIPPIEDTRHPRALITGIVIGFGFLISLIVGLYSVVEINNLNSRIDELEQNDLDSIIAMEKLLNATDGIEGILESTLWVLDHHTDHGKKIFWISESIGFADRQLQVCLLYTSPSPRDRG